MYAINTSNIFNIIIVSAVLSVLVTDKNTSPSIPISEMALNALDAQNNFRKCINSSDSDAFCVKIIDDLNLSIASNNVL